MNGYLSLREKLKSTKKVKKKFIKKSVMEYVDLRELYRDFEVDPPKSDFLLNRDVEKRFQEFHKKITRNI